VHRRRYRVEVKTKPEGKKGFEPLPLRWVVERTFAWLGRYRRLSKDYEHLPESSEAVVKIASVHPYLRRLRPKRMRRSQRFRFKGHRPKQAA
jgi:putative transposase